MVFKILYDCADNVVGFIPLFLKHWKAHSLHNPFYVRNLSDKISRHGRPLRFIFLWNCFPERRHFGVKNNNKYVRDFRVSKFFDHADEGVYGIRRYAPGVGKMGCSIECPVEIGVTVNEENPFAGFLLRVVILEFGVFRHMHLLL